jgi:superfamily II DNA helicase RecQ
MAGRDGAPALCLLFYQVTKDRLLYATAHAKNLFEVASDKGASFLRTVNQAIFYACNNALCRRRVLFRDLSEDFDLLA